MSSQPAYSPNAYQRSAYRQSAILTAPPERLVVMLYDGARRFLSQAAVATRNGNVQTAHLKLRRAEDIILHLRNSLDLSQGEIPAQLQAVYLFCGRYLNEARCQRDAEKIERVSALLGELREAWNTIASA